MNVSPTFLMNSTIIEPLNGTDQTRGVNSENMFSTIFDSAVNNLNTTNRYLSDAENEEIKLSLGETENTHDLAIALQKASTTLQYTVAIRDKFMEAYKTLINMQI